MSDLLSFQAEVEDFIARTGIAATRFGREAVNDAMFVTQLRAGREPRSSVRDRVRRYIAESATQAAA